MFFTSVRLQNYRTYIDSSFDFETGVNIIVGPNASGKTNLLDALHMISIGTTIKSPSDHIIHNNEQWSRVDVLTNQNQVRIIKIKQQEHPEIIINNKTYRRLPIDKKIPIVLFEPNNLYQITTSPEQRRMFIDDILAKTDKDFIRLKNNYTRVLRQRNSLLKLSLRDVVKQIFAWDIRLCELAGRYVQKRIQLIDKINQQSSDIYSAIANKNHKLKLEYITKTSLTNYSTDLLKQLQSNLEKDQQKGFTGYGPHRDDISILIDNYDIRNAASRGETRSTLLTLKIIEAKFLEEVYNQKPLLLLDDVFGELDGARRKSLIEFMSGSQTFITTTDADIVTHDFINDSNTVITIN